MELQMVMTLGVEKIGCHNWELTISIVKMLFFEYNEHFLSFKSVKGKTIITDGNDKDVLVTIDHMELFSQKVWAIYGDDGEKQYFTFLLPNEY